MSAGLHARNEAGVKARLHAARFPVIKTFDTFDFRLWPNVPQVTALEHKEKTYIEDGRNVAFYGPPGPETGKNHYLIAIGVAERVHGSTSNFTTADGLVNMLLTAKRRGTIDRRFRVLPRYDLLLIK